MNMKIKLYSTMAQLYIGKKYVGSIFFDKHEAEVLHDDITVHTFRKNHAEIAEINAEGGIHGSHFNEDRRH